MVAGFTHASELPCFYTMSPLFPLFPLNESVLLFNVDEVNVLLFPVVLETVPFENVLEEMDEFCIEALLTTS
jgi:hypothetical protein